MKKLLLEVSYVCILAAVLLIYVQLVSGRMDEWIGCVLMLLLLIPLFGLLYLYIAWRGRLIREIRKKEKEADSQSVKNKNIDYNEFQIIAAQYQLSSREQEVAWLLYKGYTNRQIAEELYIAETTVKKHSSHIYEKVQVSGRNEFKETIRKNYEES